MKRMWIVCERHRYWNIKGCGDGARFFATNCLICKDKACGDFCWKCGTNVPPANVDKRREYFHGKA
jgi:hypothetical protein